MGRMPVLDAGEVERAADVFLVDPEEVEADEATNSRRYRPAKIAELVASLIREGQKQECLVHRRAEDNKLMLHAGFRRRAAMIRINEQKLYDKDEWPDGMKLRVRLEEVNDEEAFRANVVENLQREDLSPIEEADAMDRFITEFGKTQAEVAKIFGCSVPTVSQRLKLRGASAALQRLIHEGKLSVESVLEALTLPEEDREEALEGLLEVQDRKVSRSDVRAAARKKHESKGGGLDKARSYKEVKTFWADLASVEDGSGGRLEEFAGQVVRFHQGRIGGRALVARLKEFGKVK